MVNLRKFLFAVGILVALLPFSRSFAESQSNDYKGITDPFGDPANYEFAEDEKEDKEFFHLGRYLMFGLDFGVGLFTGGLGRTNDPGFSIGGKLIYFFDRHIAMEAAGHYGTHLDSVPITKTQTLDLSTSLIPINLGFRYYFETKNAPRALAMANPYLAIGGGIYIRNQTPINIPTGVQATAGSTSSFGACGGGGVEFAVYGQHVYLGVDVRYHLVFFPDEDETYNNTLSPGDRAGDYFTAHATLTYSF